MHREHDDLGYVVPVRAAVAVLALAGCGGVAWHDFHPERRESTASIDDMTRRAAQVLTLDGYTVESAVDGLVVTEWREFRRSDVMGGSSTFGRWTVTIDSAGVTVDLQCRRQIGECNGQRPPGDWQAHAARLADEIAR